MRTVLTRSFVVAVAVMLGSSVIHAEERFGLKLRSSVASAPAVLSAIVTIAPDAENRVLEVAADNGEFYRSSMVQLEGDKSPRVTQVYLKNLPGGEYTVQAVLTDSHGKRTVVRRTFVVTSLLGER